MSLTPRGPFPANLQQHDDFIQIVLFQGFILVLFDSGDLFFFLFLTFSSIVRKREREKEREKRGGSEEEGEAGRATERTEGTGLLCAFS